MAKKTDRRKMVIELLLPTLFEYYGTKYADSFRIYTDYDNTYVDFVRALPDLAIHKDGRVTMCTWELDLHNPRFASLLKARVTRCLKDLKCNCKYFNGVR